MDCGSYHYHLNEGVAKVLDDLVGTPRIECKLRQEALPGAKTPTLLRAGGCLKSQFSLPFMETRRVSEVVQALRFLADASDFLDTSDLNWNFKTDSAGGCCNTLLVRG